MNYPTIDFDPATAEGQTKVIMYLGRREGKRHAEVIALLTDWWRIKKGPDGQLRHEYCANPHAYARLTLPRILPKPTVPEVREIVEDYYARPGHSVGGHLHIVLEDGNIRDRDVIFCRNQALEHGDTEGVRIADLLLRMSKTQRLKLYRERGT